MRTSRRMKIIAWGIAGCLAVAAAACSRPPEETPGGQPSGAAFKACMITDEGGIDDRSFNASAWAGLQDAAKDNSNIDESYIASNDQSNYEPNLTNAVADGCKFIQSVGGLMTDPTVKLATANPTLQFSIVDSGSSGLSNIYGIQFETQQAAFLAGYLAAGYSKTGKVGTYGGRKIPPVTIFMDGFADGVKHYNTAKSKNVQLLGWNKDTQEGLFTNDFERQDLGKQQSDTLASQGADVILPVAGPVGLGTASSAANRFAVIWVDADGCETTQFCSVILSSVLKNSRDAVKEATLKSAQTPGTLLTGGFLGTLANKGVGLAPFHEFDSKIDPALKAELTQLEQDIISGKVQVSSPAQPK